MSDKSAATAVSQAVERAKTLLFPPRLEKWLALGLLVFLSGLGEGGGYTFNVPGSGGGSGSGGPFGTGSTPQEILGQAWQWVQDHAALVIGIGSGAFVTGLALMLLFTWLSSRGKLLFVEAVIHDRYAVKEPWNRLREPAWEIFKFRVVLGLLSFFSLALAFGAGALLAWNDFKSASFGAATVAGGLLLLGILSVTVLPLAMVSALLDDFVIPVFYLRGGSLSAAWATVRRDVLAGNVGQLVLFYLLKMLLNMAFVTVAALTACFTCCVAALPYVSSVVLLPAHVFFRSYSLYFLEQLGVAVFPPEPPPAQAWQPYPQRFEP